MQDDGEWLSVSAAARRLGVSRQSLQNKIKRDTIEHRRDNRGDPQVKVVACHDRVSGAVAVAARVSATGCNATIPAAPLQGLEARPAPQDGPEFVPLSLHLAEIERLQAASAAAIAVLQNQIEQGDRRHASELARAEGLHLDLVNRFQAQAATERQIFLERVDGAEIRAEAAEARAAAVEDKLHQVLDRLLSRPPEPTEPVERPWWWRRWFGPWSVSRLRR
jgi:hypothetical protein